MEFEIRKKVLKPDAVPTIQVAESPRKSTKTSMTASPRKKMRPAYRKRQSKRVNMTPFPVPLLGLSCVLMSRPISPELVLLSDWSDSVSNMSKVENKDASNVASEQQGAGNSDQFKAFFKFLQPFLQAPFQPMQALGSPRAWRPRARAPYSGCFICGDLSHVEANCPRK